MSYLSRVWMAATVAVVQGHTDPGHKCKSGLKTFQLNRRRLFSAAGDSSDLRPLSGMRGLDIAGAGGVIENREVEDRLEQANDSLQKVMYLNCWGQG